MNRDELISYVDKENIKYKGKYPISVIANTREVPVTIIIELKAINKYTDNYIQREYIQFINKDYIEEMEKNFDNAIEKMKESEIAILKEPIKLKVIENNDNFFKHRAKFIDKDNNTYLLLQADQDSSKLCIIDNEIKDIDYYLYSDQIIEYVNRRIEINGKVIQPEGYSFCHRTPVYRTIDFENYINLSQDLIEAFDNNNYTKAIQLLDMGANREEFFTYTKKIDGWKKTMTQCDILGYAREKEEQSNGETGEDEEDEERE